MAWNPNESGYHVKLGKFTGPDGSVWIARPADGGGTTYIKVSDGYSGDAAYNEKWNVMATGEGIAQENTYSRDPFKAAGYYDDPQTAQFFRKWAERWEDSIGITWEQWKQGKMNQFNSGGKWAKRFNTQSSMMKALGFGDDLLIESPEGLTDPAAETFIQERNRQAQAASLAGAKAGTSRFTTS